MSRPNNPNEALEALHKAIKSKNVAKVARLLATDSAQVDNNAMTNGVRDFANDTLALAIRSGSPDVVDMVLAYGAQVVANATKVVANATNLEERRDYRLDSLYLAIISGNPQIVSSILNTVDAQIVNNDDKIIPDERYLEDSVSQAIRSSSPIIVEDILNKGGLVINRAHSRYSMPDYYHNSLFMAIESRNDEIVRMVIRNGGEVINDAALPENNSLNVALRGSNPNPRIIEALLEAGAMISNNEVNIDERVEAIDNMPLTASEHYGEPRRNVNRVNVAIMQYASNNHLFVATETGNPDIIDFLLTFGADPERLQGNDLQESREILIARRLELQAEEAEKIFDKASAIANSKARKSDLIISDPMEIVFLSLQEKNSLLDERQVRRAVHFAFNEQAGSNFTDYVIHGKEKDLYQGVQSEELENTPVSPDDIDAGLEENPSASVSRSTSTRTNEGQEGGRY